jgi:hypothetical protein
VRHVQVVLTAAVAKTSLMPYQHLVRAKWMAARAAGGWLCHPLPIGRVGPGKGREVQIDTHSVGCSRQRPAAATYRMKHNSPSGVAVVSISREYRQDETVVFDR